MSTTVSGVTISNLPGASVALLSDLIPIVEVGSPNVTKRATIAQILALVPSSGSGSGGGSGGGGTTTSTPALEWIDVSLAPYSVDTTGATDCTTLLQSAITAGQGKPTGAVIYFPPGTYKFSTLTVTGSNIHLIGVKGATIAALSNATSDGFVFGSGSTNPSECVIDGFIITPGGSKTAGASIRSINCHNLTIRNIVTRGVNWTGIKIDGGSGQYLVYADNVELNACANAGVVIGDSDLIATYPQGIFLSNFEIAYCGNGMMIYSCGGLQCTNVDIIGATGPAVSIVPGSGQAVVWPVFEACNADTGSNSGFYFAGSGPIGNVRMTNCWGSSNTNHGIYANTAALAGLQVNGGNFINNHQCGMLFAAGSGFSVTGALVAYNSTIGSGSFDGIQIAAGVSAFSLTGNMCGAYGDAVTASNYQNYGINILAGSSNNYTVVANNCVGNVTGGVNDGGVGTSKIVTANNPGSAGSYVIQVDGASQAGNIATYAINGGTEIADSGIHVQASPFVMALPAGASITVGGVPLSGTGNVSQAQTLVASGNIATYANTSGTSIADSGIHVQSSPFVMALPAGASITVGGVPLAGTGNVSQAQTLVASGNIATYANTAGTSIADSGIHVQASPFVMALPAGAQITIGGVAVGTGSGNVSQVNSSAQAGNIATYASAGGLTIADSGIHVQSSPFIMALPSGAQITIGGVAIGTGSGNVSQSQGSVASGNVATYSNTSGTAIADSGIHIQSSPFVMALPSGAQITIGGVAIGGGTGNVNASTTMNAQAIITGNGGLNVAASGVNITSNQLALPAGYTITIGGVALSGGGNVTAATTMSASSVISGNGGTQIAASGVVVTNSSFYGPDGGLTLGAASFRWGQVYSLYSSISTSDEREKQDIGEIPAALLDAFDAIAPQVYRWRRDGDDAAWHLGYVAQHIESALIANGLDPARYALWCKDQLFELVDGVELAVLVDGQPVYRYALRYEHLFALMDAAHRRRMTKIEARLALLEAA